MIRLVLVLTPSVPPLWYGRVRPASTAARSWARPRVADSVAGHRVPAHGTCAGCQRSGRPADEPEPPAAPDGHPEQDQSPAVDARHALEPIVPRSPDRTPPPTACGHAAGSTRPRRSNPPRPAATNPRTPHLQGHQHTKIMIAHRHHRKCARPVRLTAGLPLVRPPWMG
jgi:hypothetical protein